MRDAKGRKLFWSRGNGWVMAGLVRVLQVLDKSDPQRPTYEKLFKDMAAKVVTLQKADGYWPASLPDDDSGTPPESRRSDERSVGKECFRTCRPREGPVL